MSVARIKLYLKCMYGFGDFLHLLPFKYAFNKKRPDQIEQFQNPKIYTCFSRYSILVQIYILLALYTDIIFGKLNQCELFLLTGANSVCLIIHVAEYYHLFIFSRCSVVNIMNHILKERFIKSRISKLRHELVYLLVSSCSIIYPFLYFPMGLLVYWYMPWLGKSLFTGIEFIASGISGGDTKATLVCLAVASLAPGHAVFNAYSLVLWIFDYQVYVSESLKAMLRTTENSRRRASSTLQSDYMRLKVFSKAFHETYNFIFSVVFCNVIIIVVLLSYVTFHGGKMPWVVMLGVYIANICVIVLAHKLFSLAIDSHLLSQQLIQTCRDSGKFDSRFWKGMRPIRMGVLGVCTFEECGFLLYIWGEVVIATLIDLLLAY